MKIRAHGMEVLPLSQRASHLVGITLPPGKDVHSLKSELAKQQIYVSIRGNFMRISPHVFNTEADIERFVRKYRLRPDLLSPTECIGFSLSGF